MESVMLIHAHPEQVLKNLFMKVDMRVVIGSDVIFRILFVIIMEKHQILFCVLWKTVLQTDLVVLLILFHWNVHVTLVIKIFALKTVLSLYHPVIMLFADIMGFIVLRLLIQMESPLYGVAGKNH